jgi:hypothetical protein
MHVVLVVYCQKYRLIGPGHPLLIRNLGEEHAYEPRTTSVLPPDDTPDDNLDLDVSAMIYLRW